MVRSTSGTGYAIVNAEFGWSEDAALARLRVSERMTTLQASLPAGVVPMIASATSIMGEIMLVALTSDSAVWDRILLAEAHKAAPAGVRLDQQQFRQADFINVSVDNLLFVALKAALVVAVVLIVFLRSLRASVIALAALPMSLALSLVIFHFLGLSINAMTLGGVAPWAKWWTTAWSTLRTPSRSSSRMCASASRGR